MPDSGALDGVVALVRVAPNRFYPPEGFRWQERLFQHEQMGQQDYIWGMAFNSSDAQYRDIYDFLVQQRFHYLSRLGSHHSRRNKGLLAAGETSPTTLSAAEFGAKSGLPVEDMTEVKLSTRSG